MADLIDRGEPLRHRIRGTPVVDLLVAAGGGSLSIIVQSDTDALPRAKLANMNVRRRAADGEAFLEITTASRRLYEEFYYFAISVADDIQLRGVLPFEALQRKLAEWEQLIAPLAILTPEEQVGLWGELWLLQRLRMAHGDEALKAWVGPQGELHDFRVGATEFEVKTTRNRLRTHAIGDLRQLSPSADHDLYLLSLQVEPAGLGAGSTLPSMVHELRESFDSVSSAAFEQLLIGMGYIAAHDSYYVTPWQLSSRPVLVPVDGSCPRITADLLRKAMAEALVVRLSRVQYLANVDGLGFSDQDPRFRELLPAT